MMQTNCFLNLYNIASECSYKYIPVFERKLCSRSREGNLLEGTSIFDYRHIINSFTNHPSNELMRLSFSSFSLCRPCTFFPQMANFCFQQHKDNMTSLPAFTTLQSDSRHLDLSSVSWSLTGLISLCSNSILCFKFQKNVGPCSKKDQNKYQKLERRNKNEHSTLINSFQIFCDANREQQKTKWVFFKAAF